MPQPRDIDCYGILGIQRDCNDAELKTAYRAAAFERHPDKNPDNPNATRDFQHVENAYSILKDPNSRADYDRHTGFELFRQKYRPAANKDSTAAANGNKFKHDGSKADQPYGKEAKGGSRARKEKKAQKGHKKAEAKPKVPHRPSRFKDHPTVETMPDFSTHSEPDPEQELAAADRKEAIRQRGIERLARYRMTKEKDYVKRKVRERKRNGQHYRGGLDPELDAATHQTKQQARNRQQVEDDKFLEHIRAQFRAKFAAGLAAQARKANKELRGEDQQLKRDKKKYWNLQYKQSIKEQKARDEEQFRIWKERKTRQRMELPETRQKELEEQSTELQNMRKAQDELERRDKSRAEWDAMRAKRAELREAEITLNKAIKEEMRVARQLPRAQPRPPPMISKRMEKLAEDYLEQDWAEFLNSEREKQLLYRKIPNQATLQMKAQAIAEMTAADSLEFNSAYAAAEKEEEEIAMNAYIAMIMGGLGAKGRQSKGYHPERTTQKPNLQPKRGTTVGLERCKQAKEIATFAFEDRQRAVIETGENTQSAVAIFNEEYQKAFGALMADAGFVSHRPRRARILAKIRPSAYKCRLEFDNPFSGPKFIYKSEYTGSELSSKSESQKLVCDMASPATSASYMVTSDSDEELSL